jgi:hypothetical protein
VTVIRGRQKAPVTGHDGQLALALIEGSYLSSQTGQEIDLKPVHAAAAFE